MPEPITAPMPKAVSEMGPRVFFNLRSGSSASAISLSMDLQHKSWLDDVRTVSVVWLVVVGICAKGACLLTPARNRRIMQGGAGASPAPLTHYRFDVPRAIF